MMRWAHRIAPLLGDHSGSAVVEFALIMPIFVLVMVGGMFLSMLGFSAAGLHYAVEAGARCYSVNTTSCIDATTTQAYALSKFTNITGNAVTFVASTPSCGKQVVGSVNFNLKTGASNLTIPLSATACFP
jgi:Flp pilus assembly protein TadG